MEETDQSQNDDFSQLQKLCILFLQSNYYRKAMNDARYERMQAIRDFLSAPLSLQMYQMKTDDVEEMAIAIRKNYYQYF
jgi:hypothetical protein